MMTQQALELQVENCIVANAFEIVLLRHPLDPQDNECHTERSVGQDGLPDVLGRSNRFAERHKACLELLSKLLKQLNVLGFFACELQECAGAIVVFIQVRSHVVQHERQDELFDHAEGVKI